MHFHFPVFSFAYLAAVVLSITSAAVLYWRRASQGSQQFAFLLLSISAFSLASIFEAGATDAAGKLFWSKFQFIGIVSISPLWLYFTADFGSHSKFQENRYRHLVWIVPIITLVLAFTNEYHGLIWEQIRIPADSANHVAIYDHGFWFYVHTLYSYCILLLGTIWLVKWMLRFPKRRPIQAIIVLAVLAVGWISNITYILGLSPVPGLDITPLSFTFIALVLTWFIFNKQLFNLVPIARNILVDHLTDGVIVIDPDDHVIDYNPEALRITNYDGPSPLGMSIWDMYEPYLNLIELFRNQSNMQTELEIPGDPPRHLDVKINAISEQDGMQNGQIIIIRDVTDRKRIKLIEEEQRRLAEALADTAAAVNSTLDLEEVLDRVLENVGKVMPHDAADIALVDEQGNMRFVKAIGYQKFGAHEKLLSIEANVKDIPNMRRMAETGEPAIDPDIHADPEWVKIPGSEWIRSYIGAPILNKGKLLGFINLNAEVPNFFKEEQLSQLRAFTDQAAVAIRNAQMFEEMEHLAITDSLTGLYNRRYFFEFTENEIERSKRYKKDLSMIMMDIDHFKRVNDQFGHPIGDRALKMVSDISLRSLRKVDVMCRFGGEEFAILLPETPKDEALIAAERICREIGNACLATERGDVSVTVSIGVAGLDEEINAMNRLISAVDEALYNAKNAGRNRVYLSADK